MDRKITTGGINDPVAESIRNEQQHDAMPSADEAKQTHRRILSSRGCLVCGIDDADALELVRIHDAFCRNDLYSQHPFDSVVLCDEHVRPTDVLERATLVQAARHDDADVVAVYECGATQTASWGVPDDVELERLNPRLDAGDFDELQAGTKVRVASPPSIPVVHVGRGCGAGLDDVIRLE
jgi:hypothetical protein